MTLAEIETSNKNFLTPEDLEDVLGCKKYTINLQAKENPAKLGFPVSVLGTRVRIPRLAFIHWMHYGNAPIIKESQ